MLYQLQLYHFFLCTAHIIKRARRPTTAGRKIKDIEEQFGCHFFPSSSSWAVLPLLLDFLGPGSVRLLGFCV